VEEGIDGGKGGCVGPDIILYVYLVSPYRPSHSSFSKSGHFIPLLFYYSLKIGGGLGGANDRKEALEGDQELDKLLFVRKRPLLAMRPAGSGGEGKRLPCPVEVKVRRGWVIYRAGDEGGGGSSERAQAGATAGLGWKWYNGCDGWGEGGWYRGWGW
jgi:hypothetical protein